MLELVKRPGKSPYWIARGTINGRRIERSTRQTSKVKAREALEAILGEETSRQDLVGQSWRDRSFAQAMSDYVDHGGEARFLPRLLEHFQLIPLGDIDQATMARARNALYPAASDATVRRQLYTPIKAIINLAKDDTLKAPTGDNARTEWLWPDQVERLIQAATQNRNPMLAAMVTGLVGAGFRPNELFLIDGHKHLQLQNSFVRLPRSKNGDAREVHLISRVVAAWSLLPTVGQPGPLFRRMDGQAYQERTGRGGQIRNPFKWCAEQAGLDPSIITPYTLRHTWATWFYATTLNTRMLKQQGGWRSSQWERYTKIAPANLAYEIQRFGWHFGEVVGDERGRDRKWSIISEAQ
ncbi:MAG: tyrosine-type recombinase/integrase [Hyphomicrobiales bacterium]